MRLGTRILCLLIALVAFAATAHAQSILCPECDEDGDPEPSWYNSWDVAWTHGTDEVVGDIDMSLPEEGDDRGFWAWLSFCWTVFVQEIQEAIGVEAPVAFDGNVEVFASEDGVDLDMRVGDAFDFDDSELGDLDGMTWETMQDVNALRGDLGLPERLPVAMPRGAPSMDADVCMDMQLGICE